MKGTHMRILTTVAACALLTGVSTAHAGDGKHTHKDHKMGAGQAMVGKLMISDAWAIPKAMANKNSVAFLKIKNMGKTADRLISISGHAAAKFEIHTMKKHNGHMMMMKVKGGVPIPAGGMASLDPSGNHIMIMGLKKDLKEGSHLPLKLTFAKAGSVMIMVKVGAPKTGKKMKMDHSKHKHH
jgi:copper(I)-binding protein